MKTKVFTLAALLCCASAMYAQESGYKFTTVASQKATPVKISLYRNLLVLCHHFVHGIRTAPYGQRRI